MEMFSLIAKLVLDAKEYNSALRDAESSGNNIRDVEATLTLDDDQFVEAIHSDQEEEVDDQESVLTLDDDQFTEDIHLDQAEEVNDQEPTLTLDDDQFVTDIQEDQAETVEDQEATLTLDDTQYGDALEQAQADTESFGGAISDVFSDLKGVIAAAGITVAITGIVSSLSDAVDLARSMGDNIDKSSRAMSISTDAYQEWSHVLEINGASITDLNRGLMNMRKMMGGGEASKEFTDAMDKLGLSAKVANGEITSTEDLLSAAMKTLADFQGTSAERDYLAQAIFGRGGTKLNAMLDGTSDDIDYLINQAHELGLVMTEGEIADAAAYNDAVTNMQRSIEAFKTSIVTSLLPELTNVANAIASIVAFFNPRTKQKSLSDIYADKDDAFAEELANIEATGKAAETLVDKLFQMGDTSKMTADQYAIWKGTAEELIKLVPTLSDVIDTETGKINANSTEIKENIKQWENLAKQKALQTLKEEKYQEIVKKNKDLIDKSITANKKAAEAEGKRADGLSKINDVLRSHGLGTLDENATMEDVYDAQSRAVTNFEGDEQALANFSAELSGAISEWAKAYQEANAAEAEVNKLTKELEDGKREYEEWLVTAENMYGVALDEAKSAINSVDELKKALAGLPDRKEIKIDLQTGTVDGVQMLPKAKGDWSIPYDNFPALLHRGERVLTASQARQMDSGSYGAIVDMNALSHAVEQAIRSGMSGVSVNSFLNGRDVTDDVNRNTGRQLKARRFRG